MELERPMLVKQTELQCNYVSQPPRHQPSWQPSAARDMPTCAPLRAQAAAQAGANGLSELQANRLSPQLLRGLSGSQFHLPPANCFSIGNDTCW